MLSKFSHGLLGVLCFAGAVQSGHVQASTPASRAEVKAETRAAAKAHQLTPAGEGSAKLPASDVPSTYTRAERKSATAQARKAGELLPAGETSLSPAAKSQDDGRRSSKTRADRKAETLAARKAGGLTPAGEGPGAPKK